MPTYDQASFDATRAALLELAKGLTGYQHAFGARGDVDPVRTRSVRGADPATASPRFGGFEEDGQDWQAG